VVLSIIERFNILGVTIEYMGNITETFREKLEDTYAEFEEIESRSCTSDNHDGVEYSLTGTYIPLQPIIETVAEEEDMYIESILHIDKSTNDNDKDAEVVVFVAETEKHGIEDAFI